MKKAASKWVVLTLVASLTGCSDMTKQDVGVLSGGAVGGLLGSQFGQGNGQIAAVVGGTILGAFIGGSIGKSMDDVDKMKMSRALETAPTNKTVAWHNPDTGNNYRVTPTRTYVRHDQPCREYTTSALVGGKSQEIYGTACRQADGSWKVISSN